MSQNKIYVGNLSFDSTSDDIREEFAAFGEVADVTVISDRETGASRGFGFVEMGSESDAQSAIQGLNGREFHGRQLNVSLAKPREPRSGRPQSSRW